MNQKEQHALNVLSEFILEPRKRRPKGELAQAYIEVQASIIDLLVCSARGRLARCPRCTTDLPAWKPGGGKWVPQSDR